MDKPKQDLLWDAPHTLQWFRDTEPFPVINSRDFCTTEERRAGKVINIIRCKLFYLNDNTDKNMYQLVKQRALNQWYQILKEQTKWPETEEYPVVWLEWCQRYIQL